MSDLCEKSDIIFLYDKNDYIWIARRQKESSQKNLLLKYLKYKFNIFEFEYYIYTHKKWLLFYLLPFVLTFSSRKIVNT